MMDLNRNLKNILNKSKVKCYYCKKELDYEQLDDHELECGKCILCSSKFNENNKIPGHFLLSCAEYQINCYFCLKDFKRSKFKNHNCQIAPEQPDVSVKPPVTKVVENEPLLKPDPVPQKNPDNLTISQHWHKKKANTCFCCGIGRWFKLCRINTGKDIETRTKAFQVFVLVLLGIVEYTLSIIAWNNLFMVRKQYGHSYDGLFVASMSWDFCISFLIRFIFYL